MPEGVGQCLSGNAVSLLLYGWLKYLRRSNNAEREASSVILRKLLSAGGQAIAKLVITRHASAKIANTPPRFAQDVIATLEGVFYHFLDRIVMVHVLGCTLHPPRDALESLQ